MKLKQRCRMSAELGRTIARPKRLEILEALRRGEQSVGALARAMEVHPVSVSQELAPLRRLGVVESRREGKSVYYCLPNSKIPAFLDLLAELMGELVRARFPVRVDFKHRDK